MAMHGSEWRPPSLQNTYLSLIFNTKQSSFFRFSLPKIFFEKLTFSTAENYKVPNFLTRPINHRRGLEDFFYDRTFENVENTAGDHDGAGETFRPSQPSVSSLVFLVTMNGRAVYCAFVKRWPSRQARQIYSGCKRQQFANPALDLNSSEISYVRNSGYRAGPDETLWSAGGTPKTHLVPLVLSLAQSGGNDKTFPVRISYCSPASGNAPVYQHGLRRR